MLMFHNFSITKQDCYKTSALFYTSIKKKLAAIGCVTEQYNFIQWRMCLKNIF